MFDRVGAKYYAQECLKGNWLKVGAYMLLLNVIIWGLSWLSLIPMFGSVIVLVCSFPLQFGLIAIGLNVAKQEYVDTNTAFIGFNYLGKVLGAHLWMYLWLFLWSLPAIIVLFILTFIAIALMGMNNEFIMSLVMFVTIVASIPAMIKSYSYRLMPYILLDNTNMGARELLNESKRLTRGYKWDLFITDLSFIGWGFLAALTCGIGYFWFTPYHQVTFAKIYKDIAYGRQEQIDTKVEVNE